MSDEAAFQSILCTTDFSRGGDHAVRLASRWAEALHAALTVHHTVPPLIGMFPGTTVLDELQAAIRNDAEGKLEALASSLGGHVRVGRSMSRGFADVAIVEEAKRIEADLIVVGTTGQRTLTRRLLGSTTDRILRTSTISTLVVPTEAALAMPSHVVVGLDFSPGATRALEVATRLARTLAAKLVLVHGDEPRLFGHDPREWPTRRQTLADALCRLHRLDAATAIDVVPAPAVKALEAAVERTGAELVVLGGGGRSREAKWLLGSVTDRVVRTARASILVVREPPETEGAQ